MRLDSTQVPNRELEGDYMLQVTCFEGDRSTEQHSRYAKMLVIEAGCISAGS